MKMSESEREAVKALCAARGVARLAVFGSRARGQGRPDSDLDLLIEFAPGRAPGFFGLAELAGLLSEALGGVTVDLRTPRDLSRHFREHVLETAEAIYTA